MNMLVRAGHAFVAAEGKDPTKEGAELAAWLRSGQPIDENERELLAQLVTGYWRRPPSGRPRSTRQIQQIADAYQRRKAEYGRGGATAAKQDTAQEFGISVADVTRCNTEANKRRR
jgi:hypothetical protein